MKELVKNRVTKEVIKGFKKKDGSGTYDARLMINDEFKVRLSFDNIPRDEKPKVENSKVEKPKLP